MTLADVTIDGPAGIRVIPAGSGVRALTMLDDDRWTQLVESVDEISRELDFLLIDTATGIGDTVLDVIGLADYVLVVTSFNAASVVDAYAIIKLVTGANAVLSGRGGGQHRPRRRRGPPGVPTDFLRLRALPGQSLRYDGHVLEDRSVKDATLAQLPLMSGEAAATSESRYSAARVPPHCRAPIG